MAKTGGNQSFFPLFSCAGCNLLQSVGQNTNIITDQKRDLIMICILWIFLGAVCLYFIAGITAAVYIHCRLFNRRYEGNPKLKYFRAEDFEGLAAEEVSFISDGGQTLRGFLYTEENVSPKALIVFCHGFGAGHLSYTTEINTLARAGYAVLGYDGTGCGRSGGKHFRGFDQGPADLRAALRYADANKKIASLPRVLVGHSWGAFTVMNGYDGSVCGIAAMCGFLSGADIVAQTVSARFRLLYYFIRPFLALLNFCRMGKKANRCSVRSLSETNVPVCLFYGVKDSTVPYRRNGAVLEKFSKNRKNIQFYKWENKGHNVYLSDRAEKYLHETFAEIAAKKKRGENADALYAAVDYDLMTEEDESVMSIAVSFCDECVRRACS